MVVISIKIIQNKFSYEYIVIQKRLKTKSTLVIIVTIVIWGVPRVDSIRCGN